MNDTLVIYPDDNYCQPLDKFYKLFYPTDDYEQDLARLLSLARIAAENGWPVIPVVAGEKKPLVREWPIIPLSIEGTSKLFYKYRRNHRSIGIRTGNQVVAFDIDLRVKYDTEVMIRLVEHMLGPTPLWRFGSKGMILVYRLAKKESFSKIKIIRPKSEDIRRKALIEILCWHNQFVAGGIHPDTQRPYIWPKRNPWEMPLSEAPEICEEQIRELLPDMLSTMQELDYQCVIEQARMTTAGTSKPSIPDNLSPDDPRFKFLQLLAKGDIDCNVVSDGKINLHYCPNPECKHDDWRAGFVFYEDSFTFHCFHESCEYVNSVTWRKGWSKNDRLKLLYQRLGGTENLIIGRVWKDSTTTFQQQMFGEQQEKASPVAKMNLDRIASNFLDALGEADYTSI